MTGSGTRACATSSLGLYNRRALNQRYGHATGDRVLVAFADLLREHFDDSVMIARTGGEEFALVTTVDGDAGISEGMCHLRATTAHQLGPRTGLDRPVTVSIGFVVCLPDSDW